MEEEESSRTEKGGHQNSSTIPGSHTSKPAAAGFSGGLSPDGRPGL